MMTGLWTISVGCGFHADDSLDTTDDGDNEPCEYFSSVIQATTN